MNILRFSPLDILRFRRPAEDGDDDDDNDDASCKCYIFRDLRC